MNKPNKKWSRCEKYLASTGLQSLHGRNPRIRAACILPANLRGHEGGRSEIPLNDLCLSAQSTQICGTNRNGLADIREVESTAMFGCEVLVDSQENPHLVVKLRNLHCTQLGHVLARNNPRVWRRGLVDRARAIKMRVCCPGMARIRLSSNSFHRRDQFCVYRIWHTLTSERRDCFWWSKGAWQLHPMPNS